MDAPAAPISSSSLFTGLPADLVLSALLQQLPNGVVYYLPVYAADGTTVTDFHFSYLNPAAQRMLGLPEQPATTYLAQFPGSVASGAFAFHRDAFEANGALAILEQFYQADGYDKYIRAQARRLDAGLLVSFTDAEDQPRTLVEIALREAQAAEQAARAEAQAQRQRFYEVLMALPAQVATYYGPNHVYQFVNPAYQRYFPTQSLPGRSLREVLPETERQGVLAVMDQVYQTGEPSYQQELEVWLDLAGTGQPRQLFLNLFFHPLRNAQGQIEGLLDFSYDMTEQVQARRQVEQLNHELETRVRTRTQEADAAHMEAERQRARLARLFEEAPAGICMLDGPELVFKFVNAGFQALFPGRELIGKPVLGAMPELVGQPVPAMLRGVYETGITFEGREVLIQFVRPTDGVLEDRYFNFVYQARYDAANCIDGLIVFAFEITEQVRARQAVEASAHRLRLLTDALPVLIAYLDRTLTYRFANQAYESWFQRSPADIVGLTPPELVSPAAYAQVHPYLRQALAGERVEFELTMPYRPDFIKHIHGSFIPDIQHGVVVGFYSLLSDVTELVNARQAAEANTRQAQTMAAELASTNQQLTHTNVDLDNFIYTASHDLKAPIANIEGLLLLLRKQLPTAAQQTGLVPRVLGMMQESIERFRLTIAQLTDLTRLQQVRTEPNQAVDLATIVEAVRLDLAPLLEATSAQLTVAIDAGATVQFAPQHLRSILYNLLSNAVKYRHPARVPQVQLRCHHEENKVVLEIQDNGLGLSVPQQDKLFTLFQRLHAHVEGSGVGLYMVKRIVENAGGTIAVHSELGKGSTFTVSFPA
ncbi:PAS domain-containing protein [Hymenobacter sp. HMF4947]|uniref:histidine kinase n=1 Tax=Hymenobacter ginkgonis TaxID=2682976 RepID=A0A7K1T9Y2_9BACT|nr:PAS domain-containing sensor histidine kinase [Hymenobacter ginkgonis]MVN75206.1 PAS domain-containing protein [Hymenobacter ginkgonis]